MPLPGDPNEWREWTAQAAIRDAINGRADETHAAKQCVVCDSAVMALAPGLGVKPLLFKSKNVPLDSERAQKRLEWLTYEVHAYMHRLDEPTPTIEPEVKPEPIVAAIITAVRDGASQREAADLIGWIQGQWRPWCESRSADGKVFDEVGLRPAENAAKMLVAGIPTKAIKHSLTLHYPSEARRALGVVDYDPTTFVNREWGPVTVPADVKRHSGLHAAMPLVVAKALAGIPVALVGPPGTGKTTIARQLAGELAQIRNRPVGFGMVSMTRGTSPSAFYGRPRIASNGLDSLVSAMVARGQIDEALELAKQGFSKGDVVESQFSAIGRDGGVFLFDEMDASEPNLLLIANAALANRVFPNAATGQLESFSPDWVPVAGMNTLALGGDRRMVAREKQDAAALDRWNAGRIMITLDTALESHLFWTTVSA